MGSGVKPGNVVIFFELEKRILEYVYTNCNSIKITCLFHLESLYWRVADIQPNFIQHPRHLKINRYENQKTRPRRN